MLQTLKDKYVGCTACNLHIGRKCVVFGEGPLSPKIMFVGQNPGSAEDEAGRPFVGPAGKKLNEMIHWLGLSRSEVYVSNGCLCKSPQNRQPTLEELLACRGRLIEEINIVNPSLIVLLGRTALNAIMGTETKRPLADYMKQFLLANIGNRSYNICVVFHPIYHVYDSEKAWRTSKNNWIRIKEYVSSNK